MSAPYGPEQPDQPWQPPAQSGPPGSGWPPAAPGPYGPPSGPYGPPTPPSAPPAQYGPPHPVDPYAPQPAGPGPYGPPTPYSAPPAQYSAPPAQYGPPPPIDPYSAPPAGPGPYGPPMPYSAPPGPPTMVWPGMAPPPARNRGRNVAIVLGITLPILVIIIAVVGFLVVPKLLDNQQAGPGSSTTPTPSADPLAVPQVGSCYLASVSASPIHLAAEDGQQVACEESHSLETIAAGAVEDPTWPDEFTDQARGLYAACEQAAQEFLGVSWRSTYAWLVLSIPSESAWDDGAQWYRCDLTVNEGFYQTTPGRTTGSLRDAAQPITCLTWTVADSSLTDIAHSECSAVHQGELAGVFAVPADADYTDLDALTEDFDNQCEPIVLEFLGTGSIHEELSYWFSWPDAEDLDQWVLCLVSANEDNRAFSASLNGVGSGPIPFA